jgi:RNA polymerase sigma-B factor
VTGRDRLIESHLPLVRSLARRHHRDAGEPLEDLVQVGAIGLIKAADRYDGDRGVPFAAFAAPFIAGEIRHHLRDRCAPVRVPRRLQEEGVRVVTVGLDSVGDPPEADPADGAEDRVVLAAALRALPARERRLLQLRFVEDLSQAQIAGRTGVSQVHVSRILREALARLRQDLALASPIG